MADDGSEQSADIWPLPKFHFNVKWGNKVLSFQEVSGLDAQSEEIKYRSGDGAAFSPIEMPGLRKYGNVTMKKGIYKGDDEFWKWLDKIKKNTIKRTTVVVSLLDGDGKAVMVWTLKNAWPTKITGTDLKSEGNEVAIESIEIVHEGIEIANG